MRLGTVLAFPAALAAALALPLPGRSVARGDGISCRSRVDLRGLAEGAQTILVVEVLAADHRYEEREAYGEKVRYLQEYRFEARTIRLVRGEASGLGDRFSVRMRGGAMPGKWVVVERCYPRTIDLGKVEPGARLIVFGVGALSWQGPPESDEPRFVVADELEDAALLPRVEQVVRSGTSRRAKGGGGGR